MGTGFVPAGQLKAGDRIVTEKGIAVKLDAKRYTGQNKTVYNIEVADDHTYFVGKADGGVWVHNACGTYSFLDQLRGIPYIGKSVDLARRLAAHVRAGRLSSVGNATQNVLAQGTSNLAIRIQEQTEINAAGGIDGGLLANKINSITEANWPQYGIPPPP
jgi:hypothetical protein